MSRYSVLWLLLLAGLVGCVPSLHELYTEETLVFDPSLAGRWHQEDGRGVWVFAADAENRSYRLTITEKDDQTSVLEVRLVSFGGQRFFDFYPSDEADVKAGDWVKASLIAGHLFLRVDASASGLSVAVMNPETLDALLKARPSLVKHERVDGRVVLTDGPAGLQGLLTAGLTVEDFFGDPMMLRRAEPASR